VIDPAVIVISSDGRYLDATANALDILGVTLDELKAARPGHFAVEQEDAAAASAFRDQWEETGSPQLMGDATIRRGDGVLRRVKFAIEPVTDGFVAVIEPSDIEVASPSRVQTAGDVLAAWRAAERRLETLVSGSDEWKAARAQAEHFRSRYQKVFAARREPT